MNGLNGFGEGASSLPSRRPPANLEAERALLCSCLLKPAGIDEAAMVLDASDFYLPAHGEFWTAMMGLRDAGKAVDGVAVADALGPKLKAYGGEEFLYEISRAAAHGENAAYYAGIVKAKSMLRGLITAGAETIEECYSDLYKPEEVVSRAEARVFAIAERGAIGEAARIEQAVGLAYQEIVQPSPDSVGLSSGFDGLDRVTNGWRRGEFVVVAARPSMGKTAFGLAVACNAALRGNSVLFVSLEMSEVSLGVRMLSSQTGIDGEMLRRGELDDWQKRELIAATQVLSRTSMFIDDQPVRTVSQIAAVARRIRSRSGLDLVVIDYLSLVDGQRQRGESRQEEVARISRRLKATARELGCPVMCLHQLNREAELREGHRPRLSDLRESGQIEQDADQVILLHRPEYYDHDDRPGEAEVIVAKNRNGPTKTIPFLFRKECTRFEEMAVNGAYPGGG